MTDFSCPYCGVDLRRRGAVNTTRSHVPWWKYAPMAESPRQFCKACRGQLIPGHEPAWSLVFPSLYPLFLSACWALFGKSLSLAAYIIFVLVSCGAWIWISMSDYLYSKRKAYKRTARQFEWPEEEEPGKQS